MKVRARRRQPLVDAPPAPNHQKFQVATEMCNTRLDAPSAPVILPRYLSAPSKDCHAIDHCAGEIEGTVHLAGEWISRATACAGPAFHRGKPPRQMSLAKPEDVLTQLHISALDRIKSTGVWSPSIGERGLIRAAAGTPTRGGSDISSQGDRPEPGRLQMLPPGRGIH